MSRSSSDVTRRTSCRICDSARLRKLFSLAATPLANDFVGSDRLDERQPLYPLDLHFCEDCTHVQLLDIVNPELLFRNYVYVSGTSPAFVDHFRRYADEVSSRVQLGPESLVVDIGSNDGTLLRFFADKGARVLGVEPATRIAAEASAAGIETVDAFLDAELAGTIVAEHGEATVVTANNVFAHVDDLHGFVEAVKTMLTPGGLFVFEVSYLRDVFEKTLFDTIYHEHLSYHRVAPLIRLFDGHDMELVDVQRVPSHGGSLRGYAQRSAAARGEPAVGEAVDSEEELGLHRGDAYERFFADIEQRKSDLRELLIELKTEGRRLVGFGAPAKATTLMFHFELGPDVLDYVVDDSPLKQGLFTPGYHLPVFAPTRLYDDMPDCALILAWNFAEPIIRTHERFSAQGGRFIVPLPRVEVR
jgi:SAM-dependent methyltransferase